jgi:2-hydroxy-6-oxonona-2,4-dienedioate hydrolase
VQSRWETVAGIRGHALVGGAGRPLVLVHGLAVSSRYFVPLARRLALRHSVLAPDLPGYGRSATPPQALAIAPLAAALVEWLEIVGIAKAPLVGNSVGCQIAVEAAIAFPTRVERLVLIGPTMDPGAPTRWAQLRRLARDVPREPLGLNLAELRDYVRMGPRRILATARYALDDPLRAKLPRVTQPVLVLRGEDDRIVSQQWTEEVAGLLPHARIAVVPGAAHAAHWAAAAEVAGLIEEFE